jgi:hypothetical protein
MQTVHKTARGIGIGRATDFSLRRGQPRLLAKRIGQCSQTHQNRIAVAAFEFVELLPKRRGVYGRLPGR